MLPLMRSRNSRKKYEITSFGGLNTTWSRSLNELSETLNMSSCLYPALCSSKGFQKTADTKHKAVGAAFHNKLYTIEQDTSGNIHIGNGTEHVQLPSSFEVTASRSVASMGDEMLIIPDNCVYNFNNDTAQNGSLIQNITQKTAEERFSLLSSGTMPMPYNVWYSCKLTANSIESIKSSYNKSGTSYVFYHMSVSGEFAQGDVVTVKMDVHPVDVSHDNAYYKYVKKMKEGVMLKIKSVTSTKISTPANITQTVNHSLVFDEGTVDMGGYSEVLVRNITIEKGIPNFTDICSMDNRMWGVTKNELRCSKLGDLTQWYDFSVDEYGTLPSSCFAASVDSNGDFAAVTTLHGNILAFKEDCIHKVYGKEPNEFTVLKLNTPGVRKDAAKTIVNIGDALYYYGRNGVYRFNGSSAHLISRKIDITDLSSNCAGGDDRYYYIEFHNEEKSRLYVFDTVCQTWHITDAPENITEIINTDEGICFVSESGIYFHADTNDTPWRFVYTFGAKEFVSKHLCNVHVRYIIPPDGEISITYISRYITKELYNNISNDAGEKIITLNLPPYCSEDCKLIFEGKGKIIIPSIHIICKETDINT